MEKTEILKQGLFGVVVTIVAMLLGVALLLNEASPVSWLGLLAMFGGLLVAVRECLGWSKSGRLNGDATEAVADPLAQL